MATSWVRSRFMARSSARGRQQPRRRPLVEEALDALPAFGAGADVGDAARRVGAQLGVDLAAGDVADELLAGARRHGPLATSAAVKRATISSIAAAAHDLVREAHRLRLGGAEALGGHEVAARGLLAQGAHDVRADRRRHQAEPGFAEREGTARRPRGCRTPRRGRGRRRSSRPGCARSPAPGSCRSSTASRRAWLGVGIVLLPRVARRLAHEGQVGAGAERLAAAAEHDRAHAGVAGERANADASSRISAPLRALRTSGRSSQTRGDRPDRSIRSVVRHGDVIRSRDRREKRAIGPARVSSAWPLHRASPRSRRRRWPARARRARAARSPCRACSPCRRGTAGSPARPR